MVVAGGPALDSTAIKGLGHPNFGEPGACKAVGSEIPVGWGDLGVGEWPVGKRAASLLLPGRDTWPPGFGNSWVVREVVGGEADRVLVPASSRELRAERVDIGSAGAAAAGSMSPCTSRLPMVHDQM